MPMNLKIGVPIGGMARKSTTALAPYTGPVATGTSFPTGFNATGVAGINTSMPLWTTEAVTSLQLLFENTAADTTVGGVVTEHTSGAVALNITSVIEYPAGVYTRIQKTASSTMALAIGGTLMTDAATLSIPTNTKIVVHCFWTKQGGGNVVVPYNPYTGPYTAPLTNDIDRTGTVSTYNNAVTWTQQGAKYGPTLVLGTTTKRTFTVHGDSRTEGVMDGVTDANKGCTGEMARAILAAGHTPVNFGTGNDRADLFVASHTRRSALAAAYCTDVVLAFGINDVFSRTEYNLAQNSQTIAGYYSTKRVYYYTLPPGGIVSSDNLATIANQTIHAANYGTRHHNQRLRFGMLGAVRTFEVGDLISGSPASASSAGRDGGKVRTDQGLLYGFGGVYDPTHENALGNSTIASLGSFNFGTTPDSAPAAPTSPSTMFGAGQKGAWYDFNDLSTLFQDTAGTTPVTASGQSVARINDKSGNGNHLLQATAANRGVYTVDALTGEAYILTDGVNDCYVATFGANVSQPYTRLMGFSVAVDSFSTLFDSAPGFQCFASINAGPSTGFFWYTGGAAQPFVSAGGSLVDRLQIIAFKAEAATSRGRIDLGTAVSTGGDAAGTQAISGVTISADRTAASWSSLRLHSFICRDNMSDAEEDLARLWIAHRQRRVLS